MSTIQLNHGKLSTWHRIASHASSPFPSGSWIKILYAFLGTFAQSRKAPITFVTPVRLYQRGSHLTDFRKIWYWELSGKSVQKIQIWLNSGKNSGHFTYIPNYALLLPATLNRHKNALFDWHGIRLLVCPYVSARLPMNEFKWHFILGTSMKRYRENQN
jgi:hypothetical protein